MHEAIKNRPRMGPVGSNGEGGIRTLDRVAPIQHFQCCAFDRSATSPEVAFDEESSSLTPLEQIKSQDDNEFKRSSDQFTQKRYRASDSWMNKTS